MRFWGVLSRKEGKVGMIRERGGGGWGQEVGGAERRGVGEGCMVVGLGVMGGG